MKNFSSSLDGFPKQQRVKESKSKKKVKESNNQWVKNNRVKEAKSKSVKEIQGNGQ